jgi:hypothetical protein
MAEVRISEMTAHSTGVLAATDLIEISEDLGGGLFGSRKLTGQELFGLEWEALVTQTGTNAPVLTVIKNTLGITATIGYTSTGVYTIIGFASNLTGNIKIEASCTNGQSFCSAATSSALLLATTDDSGTNVNDVLLIGSYVKVTKY